MPLLAPQGNSRIVSVAIEHDVEKLRGWIADPAIDQLGALVRRDPIDSLGSRPTGTSNPRPLKANIP